MLGLVKQVLKRLLKPIYRRVVARIEFSVRQDFADQINDLRQELARVRARTGGPDDPPPGRPWGRDEVRAEMARLTQGVAEFQMLLTQHVADELTRLSKKLEDLGRPASQPLTAPTVGRTSRAA